MDQAAGNIWLERVVADGFPTVAAVLATRRRVFVVDTLTAPTAAAPLLAKAEAVAMNGAITVVNTHALWDHDYGNAAFADHDIVAHRACRAVLAAQLRGVGEPAPEPPPEGVPLPTIVFESALIFHCGDETVHLLHAGGHTPESIVVWLERARVLLAGDTLEWPLPCLGESSDLGAWRKTIGKLRALRPKLVIPSHGVPVAGAGLLDANEAYLGRLDRAGEGDGSVRTGGMFRAEDWVAAGVDVPAVYRNAHEENLRLAGVTDKVDISDHLG